MAPAWSFTFNSEQPQSRRTDVDSNEGGIPRLVPSLFSVFALLIKINGRCVTSSQAPLRESIFLLHNGE